MTDLDPTSPQLNPADGIYDCVVMATWSDWWAEPRSNRYHYARRFASQVPVLFCQHDPDLDAVQGEIRISRSDVEDLDIIGVPWDVTPAAVAELRSLLAARGLRRPLLWIYSPLYYGALLDAFPMSMRVLHATENYLTPSEATDIKSGLGGSVVRDAFLEMVDQADLIVAASEGVKDSIEGLAENAPPVIVAPNGVDAPFFAAARERVPGPTPEDRPVAIFQGGINGRIDVGLLRDVVAELEDWDFWFCGPVATALDGWTAVEAMSNVTVFGELNPDELADRMCRATVGLIPFIADDWIRSSLPLKAYEYVACGLPVVTAPIDALTASPHFVEAVDAASFASAIRAVGPTRLDPAQVLARVNAAESESYDRRFAEVGDALRERHRALRAASKDLNIAVLYDENSTHINTIRAHIESFATYSKHNVFYVPATGTWTTGDRPIEDVFPLDVFDVVIVHYTVRVCFDWHMNAQMIEHVARYTGLKVLFIQDEYNTPGVARDVIEHLDFDIIFGGTPPESVDYVYPPDRFGHVDYLRTLTGFVPENPELDDFVTPTSSRDVRIAYRGRKLPYIYGSLGYEKWEIGVEVRRRAKEAGVVVDIEVDDSERIYGLGWFQFLASARATLGTESGSNVFDFDGSIKAKIEARLEDNEDISFQEIFDELLEEPESQIRMNQVSPKILEAVRMRTALVLFEGDYSGVVDPDVHFIVLKKDYSNIDEVFAKLEDGAYLDAMTQRAYEHVVESGLFTLKSFVEGVDAALEARMIRGSRYELFDSLAFAIGPRGVRSLVSGDPQGFSTSRSLLIRGVHHRDALFPEMPELVRLEGAPSLRDQN